MQILLELIAYKRHLGDYETVALVEKCSLRVLNKLPKSLRIQGASPSLYKFCESEVGHALRDLEASINLMSLFVFKTLGLREPCSTNITLLLVRLLLVRFNVATDEKLRTRLSSR